MIREEADENESLLINILGGKLTTYRCLGEDVTERACRALGKPWKSWTGGEALPGGDFPQNGLSALHNRLLAEKDWLQPAHAARLARTYGTEAFTMLAGAHEPGDLGQHFGADLYEREVQHLLRNEWAQTAADILWRRTKLGLRLNARQSSMLDKWLKSRHDEP